MRSAGRSGQLGASSAEAGKRVLLLEAGLSYLGIGVQPPTPTWGNMILEAQGHLATAPRLLLIPALALVTATAAATLLGDALRARLSPHRR